MSISPPKPIAEYFAAEREGDAAEHRPLGDGGEPAGDDGRARIVSPPIGGDNDSLGNERTAHVAGIEVHAPADAIDTR